jgi:hypothetical protein
VVLVRSPVLILFSVRASFVGKEGKAHSQIHGCRKSTLQGNPHHFRRSRSLVCLFHNSSKKNLMAILLQLADHYDRSVQPSFCAFRPRTNRAATQRLHGIPIRNILSQVFSFSLYVFSHRPSVILTTMPSIFQGVYQQSAGIAGLHYIALGVGLTGASQINARAIDKVYIYLRSKNGGVGKPEFRLRSSLFSLLSWVQI